MVKVYMMGTEYHVLSHKKYPSSGYQCVKIIWYEEKFRVRYPLVCEYELKKEKKIEYRIYLFFNIKNKLSKQMKWIVYGLLIGAVSGIVLH